MMDTSGRVGNNTFSSLHSFVQGFIFGVCKDIGPTYFGDGESDDAPREIDYHDLSEDLLNRIIRDCELRMIQKPSTAVFGERDQDQGELFWRDRQSGRCKNFLPLEFFIRDEKMYAR